MKKVTMISVAFFISLVASAQQEDRQVLINDSEQQLENMAQQQDAEPEDDSFLQTLTQLKRNKLNLNLVEEADLVELKMLSAIQIQNFLSYRNLLGSLISIYELQAVPGWDLATIQKVLPYVRVGNAVPFIGTFKDRVLSGQHSVLLRYQQVLEKSDGFNRADSITNRYTGSAGKMFFRYKYVFRNLMQFGLTGDKDAGEQLFKGNQRQGFDFYSFHLFARKLGPIKSLALGDFTVNIGQGLIHWQSLAFKKSADITGVKRQAEVLRPYNSSGEYNFMRGAGITVGVKSFDFTAFVSSHKLDASLNTDTAGTNDDYISSILQSGYHRTIAEVSKKNAITQSSFGGNISFAKKDLHIGLNAIAFKFSDPLMRDVLPYNQYAIRGNGWRNYSIDYSYTYRNVHLFGEAAIDRNNAKAFLGGLLASLDAKVDASMVYRNIGKSYQALYGNAFTENLFPTNEKGFFTGISIRPAPFLRVDAYVDVFSFPWLKYRVDAPTSGSEYLLQLTCKPNRKVEIYTRFKSENKAVNLSGMGESMRQVYTRPKENWRTHLSYTISPAITYSQRVEVMRFDPYEKGRSEQGYLLYVEGKYKAMNKPWALNGRLQYFETDGFDSRLYSYENDVLYSFSIPQYIGKGFRYYFNFNFDVNKKMTLWLRWSQTIYSNQQTIGSGLDEIRGNKKSEIKLQCVYMF